MSAAELRQAAETLRERGSRATPGPWVRHDNVDVGDRYSVVVDLLGATVRGSWHDVMTVSGSGSASRSDVSYIATMHPGVGLALAEWLLIQAHHVASHDCEAHCSINGCDETNQALVVARLINGGAS